MSRNPRRKAKRHPGNQPWKDKHYRNRDQILLDEATHHNQQVLKRRRNDALNFAVWTVCCFTIGGSAAYCLYLLTH